jgi:hypothetical protein
MGAIHEAPEFIEVREELIGHPLYEEVDSVGTLRIFMKHHVFAVWDFFSLAKRLQRLVTCVEVPWLPREDGISARLINDIVMSEESDEDGHGGYTNHFSLYREAMDEIGADSGPIEAFLDRIRAGEDPLEVIDTAELPEGVRDFLRFDLELALHGEPHEVAAAFCYGREDLIPDMFGQLVGALGDEELADTRVKYYVERHIILDEHTHGPLSRRLVVLLCGDDEIKRAQAQEAAVAALRARIGLWDGVRTELVPA